jgi:outer membrane protein TolC
MLENNYKFGAEVGMPILLRQGRGDYKGAKLKIRSTYYEQSAVRVEIDNKVKHYYNELVNLLEQIRLNERALTAYSKVFEVEMERFKVGESTLFVLNNREIKVLESRQKLAELKAKFFKTAYGVEWAAGLLQ